ncbi:unnamed protein product [Arabidopsis thaliana]|uniref:F-box domain-containing protein n=1 Tax=Arabidopsis thaliana TaxID=3702 RepID=A0A5S9XSD6_ARATH|nr:unnamed protein product [Arabidopsis thaliana]
MNPSYTDLPSSLIEVIMSHLALKDNIRASAACKLWYEAGVSVRVVEKHHWLMCFPKRGNLDIISLPKCELAFEHIAFSCPPTSDDCVLLAIKFVPTDNLVTVSTCNPGATEWVTDDFPTFIRLFYMQSNLVFRRDKFYCFNAEGTLYNFDPSYRTWNYICADKLICPYVHEKQYVWREKAVVLVEKK